ncbi:MAG: pyruvate:ferredoxin (flavodoxin) oxidoreductase [Gammaproteobacteria bacterium]|nr:pyruvate:ferredoxin (flavodoxin) oxidoreductase [Gammaproteobacteria bacterium]MBU1601871.1 pyruvate:ferredoxin (flavodoxin) oxidoreductase [Gammaproteobacteria bacterium]MBU2432243.1 pyruvate:ferredoxin (flavodoxin) oxidoreductase [Gammaproteobacteria bacterium]MBU2450364.1 pyruvate:ferredoxin (flavodoxin) oxidoreductase [Gammaproteobacteria bacterium]
MNKMLTIDGNEAVANVAYRVSEVIAIYPITPSSGMGELSDEWAAQGKTNVWDCIPRVVELQSEGGAAGTVHGALQAGSLATTFTASQGLLLMIPNMYKIAGELTPTVFHVAARAVATHALSIFGDHSDVMATRGTGFALLASNSVQEAQDMAAIASAATLAGRLPVLHFFDGFRTSHEVAKIATVDDEILRKMLPPELIAAHRHRALSPEHPVLRGSSQNPDVFFQAREAQNPWFDAFPGVVQRAMDQYGELTGRQYKLFDYVGAPDAERVIVMMGSGAETAQETVEHLNRQGEKVGLLKVRLYRPWAPEALLAALPATTRAIAVLDRCKEPGADGEPLFKDVLVALAEDAAGESPRFACMPKVLGGRYGLASKEFTPAMVFAVFFRLTVGTGNKRFTVGINDDVTHLSLATDPTFRTDAVRETFGAVFYGLGSDGTVSANKNSIKIIGDETDLHAQGYFVYDSKKSGAMTVSHLRFGPQPIRATYLTGEGDAKFIACHQPLFLETHDLLAHAAPGAVFLLNTPVPADKVWATLPATMQQQMIAKRIHFHVIDAYQVALEADMGRRINTVMQTCFFAISGILPQDEAIAAIKHAVEKTYGRKGRRIAELNFKAIDKTLVCLHEVPVPAEFASADILVPERTAQHASEFVRKLTLPMIAGKGDSLPVSLFPADGTFPTGTAKYEKRNLALEIPVLETDLCTQCGKCVFVCPHSAIRAKAFPPELVAEAPATFKSMAIRSKDYPAGWKMSYQVAPEDCTGCTLCVEVCPIRDKSNVSRKALNMAEQAPLRAPEVENWDFFLKLPDYDRTVAKRNTIPGSMLLPPMFEFSGACVGCGETPYIRLATQLFGDRMLVANATGCSSIYGGNLPATPYTTDANGRGPAWNNSLFEDNAEFGLGMRIGTNKLADAARGQLRAMALEIGDAQVQALLNADQSSEAGIHEQRERVSKLLAKLSAIGTPAADQLAAVAEYLIRRSVWIIGGDGWAYDIGFGGLDHVLSSGEDVNILVLDTEVYSNTGGQNSKATPRGAVAKFAAGGQPNRKKDLARIAMDYENVYVAQVAYGAKDVHTLKAFLEAESYPGVSIIIAYSPCIAHGVDLSNNLRQQDLAVKAGHWPLLRYDPRLRSQGKNPLSVDSAAPSIPFSDFAGNEARFTILERLKPDASVYFMAQAGKDARLRHQEYVELSEMVLPEAAIDEKAQAAADKKEEPNA